MRPDGVRAPVVPLPRGISRLLSRAREIVIRDDAAALDASQDTMMEFEVQLSHVTLIVVGHGSELRITPVARLRRTATRPTRGWPPGHIRHARGVSSLPRRTRDLALPPIHPHRRRVGLGGFNGASATPVRP